jgi:flagellar biosynthesis component FlhA
VRSTSAELERQLLNRTSKLNSLWISSAAIVTMVTGFALVSITPGRSVSELGNGGWGTMILIGLVASVAAFVVSGWAGAFTARLRRGLELGEASEKQLANYRRGLSTLGYVNAVLVVIAVGTMGTARFA